MRRRPRGANGLIHRGRRVANIVDVFARKSQSRGDKSPMPLPINRFPAIWPAVSVRFLFALLIAVGLALAPFAMPMGEASATPTGHHAGMTKAGHCDDEPAPAKPGKHEDKPCCAAGCMTAAVLPDLAQAALDLPRATERPGLERFYRGFLGEIATPPPRIS